MRKKKDNSTETFTCQFSDGSFVTTTVDLEELRRILEGDVTHMTPPPIKKHLIPEYIQWMHTVMSTLARRAGRSIIYAYPNQTSEEHTFFTYQPDGSYYEIPEG